MDLWIRSQDREMLIKPDNLRIDKAEYEDDTSLWIISTHHLDTRVQHELAGYKTKERALEVLDEIQKLIIKNSEQSIYGIGISTIKNGIVYQMPEE